MLNHWKIANKVALVMALLGLVTIGLIAYSAVQIGSIDESYSQLVDHQTPATVRMVRANRLVQQMAYAAYRSIVYDGASQAFRAAVKEEQDSFAQTLNILNEAKTLQPSEAETVDGFAARTRAIQEAVAPALDDALRNDDAGAALKMRQADEAILSLRNDMAAHTDAQTQAMLKASNDNSANVGMIQKLVWTVGLVGLACASVLGLWLTRALISPEPERMAVAFTATVAMADSSLPTVSLKS